MDFIKAIFWNAGQRRPRALWRIAAQIITLMILSTALGVPLAILSAFVPMDDALVMIGVALISVVATLFSMLVVGKVMDRRPFSDFGFHINGAWWIDFGFGLALGAVLMGGIFLAELAAGWITVTGTQATPQNVGGFLPGILAQVIFYIGVGIYEEALFRGYYIRNLAEGLHTPLNNPRLALALAWALTSLLFGLAHAGNPNATFISTFNIALAGILLGIGYILTGELAIPIGLHITWNFFQGNVFGFPVSGTTSGPTFIAIQQGGPAAWTGGAFGPEAGIIGLIAMAVGLALSMLWVRWRHGRIAWAEELARYQVPAKADAALDNPAA